MTSPGRQPPSLSRDGCPDLETLAAFAEGRLGAAERAPLIAHLADCDACRELVAETVALLGEAAVVAPAGAAVVPFPDRRPQPPWRAVAAAAAVLWVAGTAFVLVRNRQPVPGATLAALAARPAELGRLDASWTEPLWSVTRGEGPVISDAARAFRLGVRSADLELALQAGDARLARRFAAESERLAEGVPLADPVAQVFRGVAAKLSAADGGAAAAAPLLAEARVGIELGRELIDPQLFDAGRWSETARLVALTDADVRWPRMPQVPSQLPPEAAEAMSDLGSRESLRRPAADRAAELARLIAVGGDLP